MRIPILPLLAVVAGLASCESHEAAVQDKLITVSEMMEAPGANYAPAVSSSSNEMPVPAAPAANRKLIYHARVRVKVADLPRANQQMDTLLRAVGAYVESVSEVREDTEWRHEMTIRVAPTRFQSMLGRLGQLGTVESKGITTEDVTAQHADITARLASKRALEQRYLELLQKASKVADMLEIEQKMGEIREEIEATESRLRTLNDEVGYSTIRLTYYQPLSQPRPDAPGALVRQPFARIVLRQLAAAYQPRAGSCGSLAPVAAAGRCRCGPANVAAAAGQPAEGLNYSPSAGQPTRQRVSRDWVTFDGPTYEPAEAAQLFHLPNLFSPMKNYVRLLPLLGLMLAGCAQSAETELAESAETTVAPAAFPPAAPAPSELTVTAEPPAPRCHWPGCGGRRATRLSTRAA